MKDQRIVPYIPDKNMLQAAAIYGDPEKFVEAYQAAIDVAPPPQTVGSEGLTDRQRDVMDFLAAYFLQYRRSPAFAEIANALGVDKSAIHHHLVQLRRKGFIRYTRRKRSIRIVASAFQTKTPKA